MWHSETSLPVLGASARGVLATGSMMQSEVFAADNSLRRQLCARLLGALTMGEWGVHRAGCMLGPGSQLCLSCLILIWKRKLVLKLACAVAHGLHVQVGHAGGRRPSQELLLVETSLRLQGESEEYIQIFLSDILHPAT